MVQVTLSFLLAGLALVFTAMASLDGDAIGVACGLAGFIGFVVVALLYAWVERKDRSRTPQDRSRLDR